MIAVPEGLLAIVLGVLIFLGSVYVLVALNTGWRFGYWITGASFGGLMVFLSLFWVASALGPRGAEPRWLPIAASADPVSQATVEEETYTSPGEYPGGQWEEPEEEGFLAEESDALGSSLSNCLAVNLGETQLPTPVEQETCEAAQELMPAQEEIPVVEGMPVIVIQEMEDIRFREEEGILLGQTVVVFLTRDPRLGDPEVGVRVGEPFYFVAARDPGAVLVPPFQYLVASTIWFAFHLWGLRRAERRRLSPVAA